MATDLRDRLKQRQAKNEIVSGNSMFDIHSSFKKPLEERSITKILLEKIVEYRGKQPFRNYIGTEKFNDLITSIKEDGLSTPITVRDLGDGTYELLSGRHRREAYKQLHMAEIDAYVEPIDTSDDAAMAILINSNMLYGHSQMTFLELIESLHMYNGILDRRQGQRTDLQSNVAAYLITDDEDETGKKDVYSKMARRFDIDRTKVVQYLKAYDNMPQKILEHIDKGMVAFKVAYEVMRLEDGNFKQELWDYILDGNRLTEPSLKVLIKEYEDRKNATLSATTTEYNSIEEVDSEEAMISPTIIDTEEVTIKAREINHILEENKEKKYFVYKRKLTELPPKMKKMSNAERMDFIDDILRQWIRNHPDEV